MKYTPAQREQVKRLYAMDRSKPLEGEYSKGRLTLKQISQRTGVGISTVYKLSRGKSEGVLELPYSVVDTARDLRESEGLTRRAIQEYLWAFNGLEVSMNTIDGWLYYRTRSYG